MNANVHFHRTEDEILSALLLFSNASSQLVLKAASSTEPLGSSILSIQEEEQVILIDELMPQVGNKVLKTGDPLKISIRHRGIDNHFNCQYLGCSEADHLPCHKLSFPPEIKYLEKRSSFRVSLRMIDQHDVFIVSAEGNRYRCRVLDLSAVGAGVLLKDPCFDAEVGDRIECNMNLCGSQLSFPGRITHLDEDVHNVGLNAGIEFLAAESSDIFRHLDKVMMELQRKNIRETTARLV